MKNDTSLLALCRLVSRISRMKNLIHIIRGNNMDSKTIIRNLRGFFRIDYRGIYLRSGAWAKREIKNRRAESKQCLKCFLAIEQAVGGCTKEHQKIIEYRYLEQLQGKQVIKMLDISKSQYYVHEREALLEFGSQLKQVYPALYEAIMEQNY